MTGKQTAVDLFNQPPPMEIHSGENNADSRANLKENKAKFSGQCAYVLALLKQGYRLTRKSAMVDHGITSLERRIKDLKDLHSVAIQSAWVLKKDGKRSHKEYYL